MPYRDCKKSSPLTVRNDFHRTPSYISVNTPLEIEHNFQWFKRSKFPGFTSFQLFIVQYFYSKAIS